MSQSEQFDVLQIITQKLAALNLKYYITGSFVLFLFGEHRITNDIDIVLELPLHRVSDFIAAFDPAEYYVPDDAIRDAALHKFTFNILYLPTMTKLDFMISKDSPYARACLQRSAPLDYMPGLSPWVSSPEDIVINKMLFYKEGGSEKHLRDIASVLKLKDRPIDQTYIRQWAQKIDVLPIWEAILKKLQESP